ncbi:hypothetical protein CONCODRAFT_13073 [Conidiobolus coronatus NRRL 28638]|uniref:Uncharacterized protein n=1 Tax=Conidiobolus coronatus (strain ATCC 28846 / CBS 209.66 / NRRL 28638) TaxID=796925 RepID=A0A137NRJ9_CONC2|nr:hypothetical protein CONCODRAFT_13073 [Conidiobolus coronatus NRRL 28638]|eukprot:KXN65357.1 hypothetical protein CONCODRAFT_13073 [Conidiobolus coronatus NRRL 28638]
MIKLISLYNRSDLLQLYYICNLFLYCYHIEFGSVDLSGVSVKVLRSFFLEFDCVRVYTGKVLSPKNMLYANSFLGIILVKPVNLGIIYTKSNQELGATFIAASSNNKADNSKNSANLVYNSSPTPVD